ncbi:MAG: nuclear transport factor 2 family protein [Gemmatimonadetes bacterium]|nr:nuclear transport factor 2 family protein [Gemmatimonadota bacterium]
MPRPRALAALLGPLLVLNLSARPASAQTPGVTATRPMEDLIRRRRESSNVAIALHDTAGFAAILAEGLFVVSSTSAHDASKREHVRSMAEWFAARPDVTYRRTPASVRVFDAWGMASESGSWVGSWTEADGKVVIGGSYFAKWRYRGGDWFVESETYVPEHCTGSVYCSRVP